MLINAKRIIGAKVHALDGDIGKVSDIYFDDKTWNLRYIVITSGSWLDSRELLLIPSSLRVPDPFYDTIITDMTRDKVQKSPSVFTDLPVSRQYENQLHRYYAWSPYWYYPMHAGFGIYPYPAVVPKPESTLNEEMKQRQDKRLENADPNLRSFNEIKKYKIDATDKELGKIEDLLIERESALITHLVLDTIEWWPSKHVAIETSFIEKINYGLRWIEVGLDSKAIKDAPAFSDSASSNPAYMESLASYYRNLRTRRTSMSEDRDRASATPDHSPMV